MEINILNFLGVGGAIFGGNFGRFFFGNFGRFLAIFVFFWYVFNWHCTASSPKDPQNFPKIAPPTTMSSSHLVHNNHFKLLNNSKTFSPVQDKAPSLRGGGPRGAKKPQNPKKNVGKGLGQKSGDLLGPIQD